jgi:flavin reductase (DIM6/NTAB) family NADH-FMN oxidoreductase RutF
MKKSLGNKTLLLPTPTMMVGTYDKQGKPNMITVAWGGICSSNPPSIAVSLQKSRYSFQSILDNKAFSVCIPSCRYAEEVDYCGIKSGRDVDKFAETGLTAVRSEILNVPIVSEFPMALVCKLITTHDLGMHTQFVGEIIDVLADEDKLNDKGIPDIALIDPMAYDTAGKGYHRIGERVRGAFLPIKSKEK